MWLDPWLMTSSQSSLTSPPPAHFELVEERPTATTAWSRSSLHVWYSLHLHNFSLWLRVTVELVSPSSSVVNYLCLLQLCLELDVLLGKFVDFILLLERLRVQVFLLECDDAWHVFLYLSSIRFTERGVHHLTTAEELSSRGGLRGVIILLYPVDLQGGLVERLYVVLVTAMSRVASLTARQSGGRS